MTNLESRGRCDMCLSRRHFLGAGLGGFFAYAMRHRAGDLFAQEGAKAKACIVLWMEGGPSQLDTFDPKPGHANGGPTKAIETAAKGVRIAASLPRVAAQMKRLSIVRSLNSAEGEHQRAQYLLHTGHPFIEGVAHPSTGAVVSKEAGGAVTIPRYVSIGQPGFGPAFLGQEHGPFALENPQTALEMLRKLDSKRGRFQLAQELGREFEKSHEDGLLKLRDGLMERTAALLDTAFPKAIDLSQEPDEVRDRYGRGGFGAGCLVARRLVEAGVRFVEVSLGGWDTHQDNFNAVGRLCGALDPAFSALVEDLEKRGLLDSTMVMWMGEFGRTPAINADTGRDHFPRAFSAVVGGGGLAGGRVIGETNAGGMEIARDPVSVADLFATVFDRFGFDHAKKYRGEGGTVVKMTEGGTPVKALF